MSLYNIRDIISKKSSGKELTWEEIEFTVKGLTNGTINQAQMGAVLMACHVRELNDTEVELLMKAMMFSGQLLYWPSEWIDKMASLQSMGATGQKAKLILAPVMAACGLKFPILSRAGPEVVGGILSKLATIPGFNGMDQSLEDIQYLLSEVGCCVVEQPRKVAPAIRIIQDIARQIAVDDNAAFKEACAVARIGALKLCAIVVDIPYGPGESIKTKSGAMEMGRIMRQLINVMAIKCHVVVTCVDHPIGQMIGNTVEILEAVQCFNGHAPPDLQELVCKLGAHVLKEAGVVTELEQGERLVDKKLKDGSARKKFGQMLQAQGVEKSNVRQLLKQKNGGYNHVWTVVPSSRLYTHLAVNESGFVHHIDVAACYGVMMEILEGEEENQTCAGGLQLMTSVGSYLNRGEMWAKIHHDRRSLSPYQLNRLKNAIKLSVDLPHVDMIVKVFEI